MVDDWRASWALAGSVAVLPFAFVQLSCWPTGGSFLPTFRYTQSSIAASQPNTGMAVTADMCDPAGAFHPIHPPWKEEVARRLWLWADGAVYGNASSPLTPPRPTSVVWDEWEGGWGDYHYGTGTGSYVCLSTGEFHCGGIRITFDRPVKVRDFYSRVGGGEGVVTGSSVYGFHSGAASGFVMAAREGGSEPLPPPTPPPFTQPVTLTSLSPDSLTLQLNVTWIGPGSPLLNTTLLYAWADYPAAMPLVDAVFDIPVAPFNVSLTSSHPKPPGVGSCTFVPDMDGASGGVGPVGGVATREDCCVACWKDPQCKAAAFASGGGGCWLKYANAPTPKAGTELCVLDY